MEKCTGSNCAAIVPAPAPAGDIDVAAEYRGDYLAWFLKTANAVTLKSDRPGKLNFNYRTYETIASRGVEFKFKNGDVLDVRFKFEPGSRYPAPAPKGSNPAGEGEKAARRDNAMYRMLEALRQQADRVIINLGDVAEEFENLDRQDVAGELRRLAQVEIEQAAEIDNLFKMVGYQPPAPSPVMSLVLQSLIQGAAGYVVSKVTVPAPSPCGMKRCSAPAPAPKKKMIYLVRTGQGKIGLTTSKPEAIKAAEETKGKVWAMPMNLYRDGGGSWDYPTFIGQSDVIFDASGEK